MPRFARLTPERKATVAVNAESAIGFVTTDEGVCRVEFLPATTYDAYVSRESEFVGIGRVTVPPNGVGTVRIVVGN